MVTLSFPVYFSNISDTAPNAPITTGTAVTFFSFQNYFPFSSRRSWYFSIFSSSLPFTLASPVTYTFTFLSAHPTHRWFWRFLLLLLLLLVHFFAVTARLKRFMEGNLWRQQFPFSFSELRHIQSSRINSRKIPQHLINGVKQSKSGAVGTARIHTIFKWRFLCRCCRDCLSSLLIDSLRYHDDDACENVA